jgi:lipopolysaccharide transport system permease protein
MHSILALLNPMLGVRIVLRNRDLLTQMLLRNLASRYRGSILGFVWSFAYPLMMLAVYTFVFGVVFKARWGIEALADNRAAYPLIMFCGMSVYNIFSESVSFSTSVIAQNPSYVKKVVFPLEILPLCTVLTSLVFGLAWFALLLLGIFVFLHQAFWTMLLLPLALLPLLFLSAGVSFLMASLGVYLRDMQPLVGIVLQVLIFMTPIFSPVSLVPENLRWVLLLNPLTSIVEHTRMLLLYGQLPDALPFLASLCFSLIVFQLGLAWFAKTKKGFADVM